MDRLDVPPAAGGIEFIGGFESTYQPARDVDVLTATGHDERWRADLELVRALGMRRLRYPVRWHHVERTPGRYDWDHTDRVFACMLALGLRPIVDLVHHTSYPRWLDGGFADQRFPGAYLDYATAVAERYPWLDGYTLFNEPFATLFLAGHEALWPPYDRGPEGFVRLLRNVLPAVAEADRRWRELLPGARHVWVDTCEAHTGTPGPPAEYARTGNDRRFCALDLYLGHGLDPARPFLAELCRAGGEDLLALPHGRVDVLGLDYYPHSEWHYDDGGGHAPSPRPAGLAALAEQYAKRYGLPLVLSETNIRGLPSDRATWLRYTLGQCETARRRGVPLDGYCWFPLLDSCDWDSLLARHAGRVDPVGVYALDTSGRPRATTMTHAFAAAVAGAPAAALPAYRLQSPARERLAGYAEQLAGWPWTNPPAEDVVPPRRLEPHPLEPDPLEPPHPPRTAAGPPAPAPHRTPGTAPHRTLGGVSRRTTVEPTTPDLVVLSHLRWNWVWQRPQHLVSRLAAERARQGARTWFVEEPLRNPAVSRPVLCSERHGAVERVWLAVPGDPEQVTFGAPGTEDYADLLAEALGDAARDVWLYSPMAVDIADALRPRLVVYDVMDDLAAFAKAPQGLRLRHHRALLDADLVFAGGRSLYASVLSVRGPVRTHLFPSGVDSEHYHGSRALRGSRQRPVAGYVGVVDERLDLALIDALAERLPDWDVQVVGPVAEPKLDPAVLPRRPNLHYAGMQPYERLPEVMAGLDVAIMPFARNEATRSISPTKTLEYLAAGLPVVSTPIPDVVADFGQVVRLAETAEAFADGCRAVLDDSVEQRDSHCAVVQGHHQWDSIAHRMGALLDGVAEPRQAEQTSTEVSA